MPLIFENGTAPDYTGFQFTTAAGLLTTIRDDLLAAGWTTAIDTNGTTMTMRGNSIVNSHTCFVQFTVKTISGNQRYLVIRGWQTFNAPSTLTTGSPDDVVRIIFVETGNNRLWLTADQEAGCICIFASDGNSGGMHFGFLDRVDPTDQWAWMVGLVNSKGYETAYVSRALINSANWRGLVDDYNSGATYNQSTQTIPTSTFDFLMRGTPYSTYASTDNRNAFRSPELGRLNYNSQAIIDSYYYLEGRGSTTAYSYRSALYFRGLVKYAYCGLAAATACQWTTVPNPANPAESFRILSTGGAQWQGMRIL